jgi:catechol-2,3-dioxygenase
MITGLNHAVLYVRDARRQQRFYGDLLGFTTVAAEAGGGYVFMRAPGSANHHDIAFFSIGSDAASSSAGRGAVGLYHLAWEVPTLGDLDAVRRRLADAGALVGSSDHGTSKSLYAHDPDGLEFEVMWLTPRASWGDDDEAVIKPLDLAADIARFGADLATSTRATAGG